MTGMELIHGVDGVVNPNTGELLTLADATLDELVQAREALNFLREQRNLAAQMLDEELVRRADQRIATGEATSYTFEAGNNHVSVDTGSARVYDADGLRTELLEMHDRGELNTGLRENEIGSAAIDETFAVRYYVKLRQLTNLQRLQPETITPLIDRFSTPSRRTVRLKPLPTHKRTIEATAHEVHS